MYTRHVFKGLDQSSSEEPKEHRAKLARFWQKLDASPEQKQVAIRVLTAGELDPDIDALFVTCPLCTHRLEAQEHFFITPDEKEVFVWQVGSEHYVEVHGIYTQALEGLIKHHLDSAGDQK